MSVEFGRMRKDEIREASRVAAQSFDDYEYFTNWFPEKEQRNRFQKELLYRVFKTDFGRSHFLVGREGEHIVAVAQLNPPEYKKASDLVYILNGWLKVYRSADRKTIDEWLEMDADAGVPCHEYQKTGPGIWYASSLTVDPSVQGTGVGTRFIAFWENYVRKNGGKELVFFTNSASNLRFYLKRGFEVFDECTVEYKGTEMGSWSVKKKLY